jgi:hypothetical protein
MQNKNGNGNMFFQLRKYQPTQDKEFKEDNICMALLFKRKLSKQLDMRVLTNMQVVIFSDILLQIIFFNQVTILEHYKNYSDIKMWRRL